MACGGCGVRYQPGSYPAQVTPPGGRYRVRVIRPVTPPPPASEKKESPPKTETPLITPPVQS